MKNITKREYKNKTVYIVKIYNKKVNYIGTYDTLEDARKARNTEIIKLNKNKKIAKIDKEVKEVSDQDWRKDHRYRQWIVFCIRRDKVCQLCGSRKKRNVHHIKNGHNHPAYRFDPENGVTLCRDCHTAFHCSYKKSFREKCGESDWYNFIEFINYTNSRKLDTSKFC